MSAEKPQITLSHRLEYAALMGVIGLLRLMPLETASAFMGWLWRAIAPKLSRQKRAMAHLRASLPEKSEEELEQITIAMWDNLGRTFAEGLLADRFREAAADFSMPDDFKAMDEVLREKGGVVVSLHSGNWELAGIVASRLDYDLAAVYQKMKNPLVDEFVTSQRSAEFRGGMYAKGNKAGAKLMSWVKEGNVSAVMGDLRDRRGVEVEFFGRPAPSNIFPARMARMLDVPLYCVRILREDGLNFKVEAERVALDNSDDMEADIVDGTQKVQAVFEKWIRARPDQWMWAHKRWG